MQAPAQFCGKPHLHSGSDVIQGHEPGWKKLPEHVCCLPHQKNFPHPYPSFTSSCCSWVLRLCYLPLFFLFLTEVMLLRNFPFHSCHPHASMYFTLTHVDFNFILLCVSFTLCIISYLNLPWYFLSAHIWFRSIFKKCFSLFLWNIRIFFLPSLLPSFLILNLLYTFF